ncbi:hypothetical protein F4780DRAFT_213811 [Xylariomycetidae sp. FL0641]|nr:hypothetical protein F4780DRAFT_213811 [Xylariomycetidae sp. FL0641]
MAKQPDDRDNSGRLLVRRRNHETGRQRHRISKSVPIRWEKNLPGPLPAADHEPENQNAGNAAAPDVDSDEEMGQFDPGLDLLVGQLFGTAGIPPTQVDGDMDMEEPGDDSEFETDNGTATDSDAELGGLADNPASAFEDEADEDAIPQVAVWRMNLTALSKTYNFYAVAYRDKIHISRPRSCVTNVLPAKPDLVLSPEPSKAARMVGGTIEYNCPHAANHLIVGHFGDKEILLIAYDDGDAIAYYTQHIEHALSYQESDAGVTAPTVPRPFFHENVGKSAWGLAIHAQSRLIAVSSNKFEVSVFVPALADLETQAAAQSMKKRKRCPKTPAKPKEFFRTIIKGEQGLACDPKLGPSGLEDMWEESEQRKHRELFRALPAALRRRDENWRIVLKTGPTRNNIPNIAFSSDADGDADKIVAVDIDGRLWIMDIWSVAGCPHISIDDAMRLPNRRNNNHFETHRGWGVLVLPETSFLPTKDFEDSLGLPPDAATWVTKENIGRWIDISKSVDRLRDNSKEHPMDRFHRSRHPNTHNIEAFNRWGRWYEKLPDATPLAWGEDDQKTDRDLKWASFQTGSRSPAVKEEEEEEGLTPNSVLAAGSSIMRMYEMDIELRSAEEDGVGIVCEHAIRQTRPRNHFHQAFGFHERLSNLVHVPELCLVVAASMCGRVALITLTRPKHQRFSFKRGFRIETILPTKSEEDNCLRPLCPLLGIAVAPLPSPKSPRSPDEAEDSQQGLGSRRYRLMLHYYDLQILSYEVYRNVGTEELSVI